MKKFICLALIFLSVCIFPKKACAQAYTDLDETHWAYDKIISLTQDRVLAGYPDETFRPDEKVTRAEFATMVINGLNQQNAELKEIINFKDLPKKHWAYNTVERAVRFDLIIGTPEGYFYPQEPVTRAHAIAVAVNALDTRSISEEKAREYLKNFYEDYELIPNWIVVNAGKAEILNMNVKVPKTENLFRANDPATRAEAAVAVYNMVEQARLNPNQKLAAVMRPQIEDGIIINEAVYKGSVITIPEGTILPVAMIDGVSTQTNQGTELFLAKVPQNYITSEKYLIISQNSPIAGQVLEVKKGKYFVRNGKLTLATKSILTSDKGNQGEFNGIVDTKIKRKFWARLGRAIFKGAKINIQEGSIVNVELLKPLKINAVNGKFLK